MQSTSRSVVAAFLVWYVGIPLTFAGDGDFPSEPDRTLLPEQTDFSDGPYSKYGEVDEGAEEQESTRFFQYSRFVGLSLGLGYEPIIGNRGSLWNGGFPTIEFKIHYWFDFNFAMMLDVYSASHFYENPDASIGRVDVNLVHLGLDLKYYFTTKNMASTVSFANPYILIGAGTYRKTETTPNVSTSDTDTSFGLSAGAGLEFAISPKQVYFQIESKIHFVDFRDTTIQQYSDPSAGGIPDLTGQLITVVGHILFTW